MHIGNYNRKNGESFPLNKWIWGVEILKCSPTRYPRYLFKPHIFVYFVKFERFAEYGMIGGKQEKKKGFYKWFESPIGIYLDFKFINDKKTTFRL